MQMELIYQMMSGEIDAENISLSEKIEVTDEFAEDRECGKLYSKVYSAKLRLNEKLGVQEDSDVEEIISCMGDISRIMAFKMYQFGSQLREKMTDA